jgi:hypothetical protein
MEQVNDCGQSYHAIWREGRIDSCFVSFKGHHNLLVWTNSPVPWPIRITFVYLPLSASTAGFVMGEARQELAETLRSIRGNVIVINARAEDHFEGLIPGRYLPVCILDNRWADFDSYVADMRSNYRRRIHQALQRGKDVEVGLLPDNSFFGADLYRLYEQVFDHSRYRLEKLPLDFFRNDFSRVLTLCVDGRPEAFVQLIEDGDTLIFEFGGYNRAQNATYDLYQRMLLELTRYGIDHGFNRIDYGQTAYDCKLRFGGELTPTYTWFTSSNSLTHALVQRLAPRISYGLPNPSFHVFKGDGDG